MQDNYYNNTEVLNVNGYEIYYTRFYYSIIKDHFSQAVEDLQAALKAFDEFSINSHFK